MFCIEVVLSYNHSSYPSSPQTLLTHASSISPQTYRRKLCFTRLGSIFVACCSKGEKKRFKYSLIGSVFVQTFKKLCQEDFIKKKIIKVVKCSLRFLTSNVNRFKQMHLITAQAYYCKYNSVWANTMGHLHMKRYTICYEVCKLFINVYEQFAQMLNKEKPWMLKKM